MPRWDYRCPECETVKTDVIMSNWREANGCPVFCPECGKRMNKVPAAASFTVGGYNAANHYGAKRD